MVVAAPTTTFDLACADGAAIPIEQRDGAEVRTIGRRRLTPAEVSVYNPAFDVTPPELVAAIVSERGVARPVTAESVREIAG
jgi:methylthioribose-1-phosphate isomerase